MQTETLLNSANENLRSAGGVLSAHQSNWVAREKDSDFSINQSIASDAPALVLRLLQARKITDELEIQDILNPRLSSLKDPMTMLNMPVAAQRLADAFKKDESVCIYADFDLDGTSGLALLFEGLRALGFSKLSYYQPKRLSQGYGFHASVVEELKDAGVQLIVTVDVGITAIEACKRARELELEVIITDHHQPAVELPTAFAVVNPNQAGDQSGLGYLCGAGVGFYLLRAVQRLLCEQACVRRINLVELLDFLAIATLTDLVPLKGDNRALVKAGLRSLEITKRPGLRSLLRALQLEGRPLSGQDVAIRFAPKLNALSRMENGLLPVDLFLLRDADLAGQMVDSVLANNQDRVQLQGDGEALAMSLLSDWPHEQFVFVASSHFHRGVIGLIATKLAQNFNRPAFVGAENSEGVIVGSSRIPAGEDCSVLLGLQSAAAALTRFGGHHAAAGFELHQTQKSNFINLLLEHFQNLNTELSAITHEFDFYLSSEDITQDNMQALESIGPFGQAFPVPLFGFTGLRLKSVRELKGGHLKFVVLSRSGAEFEALYFSPPKNLKIPEPEHSLDCLAELQWNYFAGRKKIQLLLRDFKVIG